MQIDYALRDDPSDDDFSVSRWAFSATFKELWREAGCIVKLPTASGELDWECFVLPKALAHVVKQSAAFKNALEKLFQTTPCAVDDPYHLVAYADEVGLATNRHRGPLRLQVGGTPPT